MTFEIGPDLRYLRTGEWARSEGDIVVCGIDRYAEIARAACMYVGLPLLGDDFEEGDSFGFVESLVGVTDIYAPVSGTVIAVNSALQSSPATLTEDPYIKGWIIQLRPRDAAEINRLLSAEAYLEWLTEVESSRETWTHRRDHSPEYLIGVIVGKHRVVSIQGMGAESVVFNLQDVETGNVDRVLKMPSDEFPTSWWSDRSGKP